MSKTAGKENPLGPFGSVEKLHLGERTLNRVLTKQEKKRIRDFSRDFVLERGFDPNLVRPVTDYCRTTLDVEILNIFTRKLVDEAEAKGCAPGERLRSVMTRERIAELWAEAEAEAKKPLN